MAGEEARRQLHKNSACNLEQVLAANPTRHQLYGHLPPISKTIQVRRTRHAGQYWRSRDELIRDVLLWTPYMAVQKQDDQHEHTFSSYVRIRDAVLKTYLGRWTIGRSGERGSGISVLPARYDDDDYRVYVGWHTVYMKVQTQHVVLTGYKFVGVSYFCYILLLLYVLMTIAIYIYIYIYIYIMQSEENW